MGARRGRDEDGARPVGDSAGEARATAGPRHHAEGSNHANGRTDTRSSLIHVRVKPALRERIESQAANEGVPASVIIRRVLASHFEKVKV